MNRVSASIPERAALWGGVSSHLIPTSLEQYLACARSTGEPGGAFSVHTGGLCAGALHTGGLQRRKSACRGSTRQGPTRWSENMASETRQPTNSPSVDETVRAAWAGLGGAAGRRRRGRSAWDLGAHLRG